MDNEQNSAADDAGPEGTQGPDHALLNRIDSILSSQALSAAAHVRKMRAKKPDLTPAAAIKKLNRQLLSASAAAGAAAGATGAAPGVGKAVNAAMTLGGHIVSLPKALFYILAVAEVHQVPPADIEHRRKLALSILLDNGAASAMPVFAKKTSKNWTRKALDAIPGSALKPINNFVYRNFITKTGPTGTIVLEVVLPYAMGAAIGATSSFATTSAVIGATRLAFGPPKPAFDAEVPEESPVVD